MSSQPCFQLAYWLTAAGIALAVEFTAAIALRPQPVWSQPVLERTDPSERDRLYEEGVSLQEAGQYYGAIAAFRRALNTIESGDTLSERDRQWKAEILNQLGNVHLALGEYEVASGYYDQAIEVRQATPIAAQPSPQSAPSGSMTRSLNLQMPDITAASMATNGGSRGIIGLGYGLAALLPSTGFGFTTAAHPKIFVLVAEPVEGTAAELFITEYGDDGAKLIYGTTRSLTLPTVGIFGIDFAMLNGMPPLETGKRYRWQLTLTSDVVSGEVERVSEIDLGDRSSPVDAVYADAEAGLWYDAIANLYELERQGEAPDGLWPEILQLAELDHLVAAPLLGEWSGLSAVTVSEEPVAPAAATRSRRSSGGGGSGRSSGGGSGFLFPDLGAPNPPGSGGSR